MSSNGELLTNKLKQGLINKIGSLSPRNKPFDLKNNEIGSQLRISDRSHTDFIPRVG